MGETAQIRMFPNIVLWGEPYVRSFLDVTLPTLLAPGNLETLRDYPGSTFLIACPAREQAMILESPQYHHLSRDVSVQFLSIDWDLREVTNPILNMSRGHQRICEQISRSEGFAIFLSPDCLVSKNAFRYAVDAAANGTQLIAAPGFRLIKEDMEQTLREIKNDDVVQLSGRDMVRHFMAHKHPEMDGYFVDSETFTRYPHYCFWRLKASRGIVVRAFHLHPFMVRIPRDAPLDALENNTIDGDFVGRFIGDFEKIKVVNDLDTMAIFSLSPRSSLAPEGVKHRFEPSHVSKFAFSHLNAAIHRFYFTQAILLRGGGDDDAEVARLVAASGVAAHAVLRPARPTRYIGFSHETGADPLSDFTTTELISELKRRILQSSWRRRFKEANHLLRSALPRHRSAAD